MRLRPQRFNLGRVCLACATISSNAFAFPYITNRASCCGFDRATAVIDCTKSKTVSGRRPSSASTVSTKLSFRISFAEM